MCESVVPHSRKDITRTEVTAGSPHFINQEQLP